MDRLEGNVASITSAANGMGNAAARAGNEGQAVPA
jgi:hypothetical protein